MALLAGRLSPGEARCVLGAGWSVGRKNRSLTPVRSPEATLGHKLADGGGERQAGRRIASRR
ncbi:MAG: hypothetical protein WCK33_01310 [Phycisphaerae bacterium]